MSFTFVFPTNFLMPSQLIIENIHFFGHSKIPIFLDLKNVGGSDFTEVLIHSALISLI